MQTGATGTSSWTTCFETYAEREGQETPSEIEIKENENNVMSQHSHEDRGDHSSSLIRSPLGSSAAVCNVSSLSFFALASSSSCSLAQTLYSNFDPADSYFVEEINMQKGENKPTTQSSTAASSSSRDVGQPVEQVAVVVGRNPSPNVDEPLIALGDFKPRRTPQDAMSDDSFEALPEEISKLDIAKRDDDQLATVYGMIEEMGSAPEGDASEAMASDGRKSSNHHL